MAHYDLYDYQSYWQGREYEHEAERLAIQEFLKKIPTNSKWLEVGAGFGRLAPIYQPHSNSITLLDPSAKNLSQAKKLLRTSSNLINYVQGSAEKVPLPDENFNVVICVRVMHHLPQPEAAISEINRLLTTGGFLILEFANKLHLKNLATTPIDKFGDTTPSDIRSPQNIAKNTIPFVNHHPKFILSLLNKYNFQIIATRSVSNLRNPWLKQKLPLKLMLFIESKIQTISSLTKLFIGPSVFILAQKKA